MLPLERCWGFCESRLKFGHVLGRPACDLIHQLETKVNRSDKDEMCLKTYQKATPSSRGILYASRSLGRKVDTIAQHTLQ